MNVMPHMTNDILFVHPVKTGGTWVERQLEARTRSLMTAALERGVPPEKLTERYYCTQVGEQHDPLRNVLEHAEGKTIAIATRHPLTWYGSVFLHGSHHPANRERLKQYGGGSLKYKDVLYGMTHPEEARVPKILLVITNVHQPERQAFIDRGEGLYSFHFRELGCVEGQWKPTVVLRQEALSAQFDRWLGTDTEAVEHHNTHRRPHDLEVPKGPYLDWYDREMLSWVRKNDGFMAAFLGYKL